MTFPISPAEHTAIVRQYEINMVRYPILHSEVDGFLQNLEQPQRLCLQYLYGHMAAADLLSTSVEVLHGYVQATLQACRQIDYVKTIPADIFFPYVLYHRVNSEHLDASRSLLLSRLLPYVQGKTMEQAALAVNYWCYAHATYTPADDRTLGVLGVLNRTLGRCGEESVLAVAALRSVGIPARQCYCPRWSHCDDNHAWVEVWIDGHWRYLGACEPEPVLDRGWFTAAASRAMLVDSKCWSGEDLYEAVNCTHRYTRTRVLTAQVMDQGLPVAGAKVRFQIVNYSQLYTLSQAETDENGCARFETGPGDLFVYAKYGQKVALEKVDLRQTDAVTLTLQDSFPPQLAADLVPPADSSGAVPYSDDPQHHAILRRCEAHLAARRATFAQWDGYLRHAAGNAPQVQAFLEDPRFPLTQKQELLATLRPKDFVDITCQTLADALETANAVRGQYPADIFRDSILAPRIADEMLLPQRKAIRSLFPDGFADPRQILGWMQETMQRLPDDGICNYYPSAYCCLRYRQVPGYAFDMVFVALCRAFCFPARLDVHTGHAQWLDGGYWRSIQPVQEPVQLRLQLPQDSRLNDAEHITLSKWDGSDFVPLPYPELTVENGHRFCLQPGFYRVTVTTRQIDGTASVALWHLPLTEDTTLAITPPSDQTAQRLLQIPLSLPDGPLQNLLQTDSRPLLLVFADPGKEPTEHLLREMLERQADYRTLSCRILLLVSTPQALTHPTVQLVKAAIGSAEFVCLQDSEALAYLHKAMQVGDLRLPFVICTDHQGNGVYADANYRIRLAQTLLEVQTLLADHQ